MNSSSLPDPQTHPIAPTDRGDALRLAWGLLDIPWHDRFDQPAFTVEILAMPRVVREWLVTGVFPETSSRPESGWALMIGHQGELAAMIVTRNSKTRIVWNHSRILDGQWHRLAMSYDGTQLSLYVDGKTSKQEELLTDPVYLGHGPGLRIGAHTAVVCEGLVQEMHLSHGQQMLGHWRLDQRRCDGEVPDLLGKSPAGIVKAFAPESLDESEKREFHPGPAPFDLPSQQVQLQIGEIDHAAAAPILLLDGDWKLAEGNGDEANWDPAIPAQIPGSVHTALQNAGKIPDPTFGLNDAIAREQSFKTWWFRKTFPRPDGDRHRLIFDGVAIHSTIWLNGEKLGEHEGMFGGPSFDISHLLRDTNELIVKLDPAPTGPPWFAPTANTGWKKTVVFNNVYGWHYCHIPALGIWRSVRIESIPAVKLRDPFVVTHDAHKGEISIRVDLQSDQPISDGELLGTIAPENFQGESHHFAFPVGRGKGSAPSPLAGEGWGEGEKPSFSRSDTYRKSALTPHPSPLPQGERGQCVHLRLRIPDPKLWWPTGIGEQNLYRLTLSFVPKSGAQSDCVSTTFGLRTIHMSPLPGGPRPTLYNWTFVINGRPTFMKGTGWCTMDAAMDFSRDRYERFLRLAKEQNCQMLRCWGSGMPETDDFYDLCDRLGLVVMQEWPTAWNSHEEQPLDALEETVRWNTLRLRNHPSLLMWGGGNESTKPFGPAIDMMGRLATELDGTRPFHRGEPWGGSDHNYGCWWGNLPLDHNLKLTGRFFGEFGIASMPNHKSVQRYLPVDQKNLWPAPPDGVLAHHTPVFNTMQDMVRLLQYAGYFSACSTMQRFIVASQIAQAVAVRHTLERARCRWPHCTGALMYKLNDNFPGASWSTVDWYGAAKLSHWFVQNAFAPLHGCLLFDSVNHRGKPISLPVFLLDDADALADSAWKMEVRAYNSQLRLIQAEEYSGSGSINRVSQLGEFLLTDRQTNTAPLLFVLDVRRNGELADRTFYFVNYEDPKDCLFNLPVTTLSLQIDGSDAILTNTGTLPAVGAMVQRMVHLDTFSASDNCIWLEPGESHRIHVSHTEGLSADAWNLRS